VQYSIAKSLPGADSGSDTASTTRWEPITGADAGAGVSGGRETDSSRERAGAGECAPEARPLRLPDLGVLGVLGDLDALGISAGPADTRSRHEVVGALGAGTLTGAGAALRDTFALASGGPRGWRVTVLAVATKL